MKTLKQPLFEKKSDFSCSFGTRPIQQAFPSLILLIGNKELMGLVYRCLTVPDLMVMACTSKALAQYRKIYAQNYITNTQLMTILEGAARHTKLSSFLVRIAKHLRDHFDGAGSEIPASLLPAVDQKHQNFEDYEEDKDYKTVNNQKMLKVLPPANIESLKKIVIGVRGQCEPHCDDIKTCGRALCIMVSLTLMLSCVGCIFGCSIGCCVGACAGVGCSCNSAYLNGGIIMGEALGGTVGLGSSCAALYEETFRCECNDYLNQYRLFASLVPAELERYEKTAKKENLQLLVNPPKSQQAAPSSR